VEVGLGENIYRVIMCAVYIAFPVVFCC